MDNPNNILKPFIFKTINFGEFGIINIVQSTPEQFNYEILKYIVYNILPKLDIGEDQLKQFLIHKNFCEIIGVSNPETYPFNLLMNMVEQMRKSKEEADKRKLEELTEEEKKQKDIEFIKNEFNLYEIDLDDNTILEVYEYMRKIIN